MNNLYKTGHLILLLVLGQVTLFSPLFGQNQYKRKICISEWVDEMEKCKENVYELENTEIYYNFRKDTLYTWNQARNIEPSVKDLRSEKSISAMIIVKKCKLPDNSTCQVRNIVFQSNVTFSNCEGASQLIFYNCTFKQGLDLHFSDLGSLEFRFCSLLKRIVVYELQSNYLFIKNCSFDIDHKVAKTTHVYGFEKENQLFQYLFYINQNEKKINTFDFSHCKLLSSNVKPVLFFNGGKYDAIRITGINFGHSILDFEECSVKENFTVSSCTFKQPLGMLHFNFPKDNTTFLWSQIDSAGLGLYADYTKPYTSHSDSLFFNVSLFNELNSSYRKFYSMYRTQGDVESANACLIQLKDMETRKYHHVYQQNPNINTWFNWRFNQFLKSFSEYGTNPVQSLIISMWTILIFAGVYFFFYSDWDGINRTFLIKQHRKTMRYFRSEQRLEGLYTERHVEDLKTFADYKKEMEESRHRIPFFIRIPGKPLYVLSIIRHRLLLFIYQRAEILNGRWVDLKPTRKMVVGLTVSLSLLIYIVYLGLIRALNSTTLSLNAFSTLGFGAIPVKGLSRYITIIEGFLGWFLLTIVR